jgi:pimeloyl-ACP methyl ester carboxylesterase
VQAIGIDHGRARLAGVCWGADLGGSGGGAGGPTVVALHPGVGDSRIWQWCAPVWADAGYRVIAYDRRGFGDTRYEPEVHDDVDDLLAVTRALDARPAVLVGNSRGGGLALEYALAHPDLVEALVLVAPSVSGYDDGDWPITPGEAALDELIEAAEASGDLAALNRLEVRYWLDGVDQPAGRVDGPARLLMETMNGQALRARNPGPAAAHPPTWTRLAHIHCPVLVAAGEHDLVGIVRRSRELADALPAGRFAEIAGSAHCPSVDQPDALNELVLEFLLEQRR